MAYTPKFKEKDLKQIARNYLSSDYSKWETSPVKFEWKPKQQLVLLHFNYDNPDLKDKTWTMSVPIRPFEIGYKPYIAEIEEQYKKTKDKKEYYYPGSDCQE